MNNDMDNRRTTRDGLSLIEVMLAMAILGIGLFVLIESASRSLAVVRAARLYDHAHSLLNQVELRNPLINKELEVGVEQGRFDDPEFRDYQWTRTIEVVGDEEDELFLVTTRVSWTRRGQSSFEEMAQYRYAPKEDLNAMPGTQRESTAASGTQRDSNTPSTTQGGPRTVPTIKR